MATGDSRETPAAYYPLPARGAGAGANPKRQRARSAEKPVGDKYPVRRSWSNGRSGQQNTPLRPSGPFFRVHRRSAGHHSAKKEAAPVRVQRAESSAQTPNAIIESVHVGTGHGRSSEQLLAIGLRSRRTKAGGEKVQRPMRPPTCPVGVKPRDLLWTNSTMTTRK